MSNEKLDEFFETLGKCLKPVWYVTGKDDIPEIDNQKARGQETQVMKLFRMRNYDMTASMIYFDLIHNDMIHPNTPRWSIRRAVSNLKSTGHLIKTNERRLGDYGRSEHYYKLA